MGASVIIAAAGSAQRMNGIDKILYKICDREIISYSLLAFSRAKCTEKIVIVTSKDKIELINEIVKALGLTVEISVVEGSDSRQKSVFCGLAHCGDSDCVMIHDAARPMITPEQIDNLYNEVTQNGKNAATLGVRVKDTIKIVDQSGKICETPKRETLFAVQTPQAFSMSLYKKAAQTATKNLKDYTDDCQLVEALGESVHIVEGDYKNIKITTPEDLISAQNFLRERE